MVVGMVLVAGAWVPCVVVDFQYVLEVLLEVWVLFNHTSEHEGAAFKDLDTWV